MVCLPLTAQGFGFGCGGSPPSPLVVVSRSSSLLVSLMAMLTIAAPTATLDCFSLHNFTSTQDSWLHICSSRCVPNSNVVMVRMERQRRSSLHIASGRKRRRTLVFAVNQDAESSFKKTVEVDRLIDTLRDANANQLQKLVVENVLAFNESFWIRLAARTDTCKSDDDKRDYEELAQSVMSIVDRLVHKTNEKIESATDILKEILKPVIDEVGEISWPPKDPQSLILMEKELEQREKEGQLDEGFLSEVNAQLRQAKEDGDKPGLEAMLQKVLQLYASKVLSKRSYAYKGGEVLRVEEFLETVIKAPEEDWNRLLLDGLSLGKGEIPSDKFYAAIKKRIERTLIRTEGGSYQQRILTEYLRGIQSRTEEIAQALEGKQQ